MFFIFKYIQAQSGVTSNKCFYEKGRYVKTGSLITSLGVSGASDTQNLEACCNLCRGLPNCIAWDLYPTNKCYFYREVLTYTTNINYYSGSSLGTQFWSCSTSDDLWYFDNALKWTKQADAVSRNSTADCCKTCYFKWNTCKSYMYNENLKDCFHSTINFEDKQYSNYTGMHTGHSFMSYVNAFNS